MGRKGYWASVITIILFTHQYLNCILEFRVDAGGVKKTSVFILTLNFEQTLCPGISIMSISFSTYFVFLFLAETLCWYKDDEVGFKLKILEFMLQGTFQGWSNKTNLFCVVILLNLGNANYFCGKYTPLTCGSSNYCQLSKMLRGHFYGCTVLLCNGVKSELPSQRQNSVSPLRPCDMSSCVYLLLQVASARPAAWPSVVMERIHMTSLAAILVFENNETAMLVYQKNPVKVELFSYVNTFFCSNEFV